MLNVFISPGIILFGPQLEIIYCESGLRVILKLSSCGGILVFWLKSILILMQSLDIARLDKFIWFEFNCRS